MMLRRSVLAASLLPLAARAQAPNRRVRIGQATPAISFLQNFNDDSYDILLQAKDFYSFEIMVLIAMGVLLYSNELTRLNSEALSLMDDLGINFFSNL